MVAAAPDVRASLKQYLNERKAPQWIDFTRLEESGRGLVEELEGGRYRVRCKGQHCGIVNRNNRSYPKNVWGRHLKEGAPFAEKVRSRRVIGHLEHPDDGKSKMGLGAVVVTEVSLPDENGEVWIVFETMSTPAGRIVEAYIRDRVGFGISSRGNGSVLSRNGVDEVQDDFDPVSFDCVIDESTPGAEVHARKFMESINALMQEAKGDVETARKLDEAQVSEALSRDGLDCSGGVCKCLVTETVIPPSGFSKFVLAEDNGSSHYRAYQGSAGLWEVWKHPHNNAPIRVASSIPAGRSAHQVAASHLSHIGDWRAALASLRETWEVVTSIPYSGTMLEVACASPAECKKALKTVKDAGFHSNEIDSTSFCVYTSYEDGEQAAAHIHRLLSDKGLSMKTEAVGGISKGIVYGPEDIMTKIHEAGPTDSQPGGYAGGSTVPDDTEEVQGELDSISPEFGGMDPEDLDLDLDVNEACGEGCDCPECSKNESGYDGGYGEDDYAMEAEGEDDYDDMDDMGGEYDEPENEAMLNDMGGEDDYEDDVMGADDYDGMETEDGDYDDMGGDYEDDDMPEESYFGEAATKNYVPRRSSGGMTQVSGPGAKKTKDRGRLRPANAAAKAHVASVNKKDEGVYYKTLARSAGGVNVGDVRVWFNEGDEPVQYEYYSTRGVLETVRDGSGALLRENAYSDSAQSTIGNEMSKLKGKRGMTQQQKIGQAIGKARGKGQKVPAMGESRMVNGVKHRFDKSGALMEAVSQTGVMLYSRPRLREMTDDMASIVAAIKKHQEAIKKLLAKKAAAKSKKEAVFMDARGNPIYEMTDDMASIVAAIKKHQDAIKKLLAKKAAAKSKKESYEIEEMTNDMAQVVAAIKKHQEAIAKLKKKQASVKKESRFTDSRGNPIYEMSNDMAQIVAAIKKHQAAIAKLTKKRAAAKSKKESYVEEMWTSEDGDDYQAPFMEDELSTRHGGSTGVSTKGDEYMGDGRPQYHKNTAFQNKNNSGDLGDGAEPPDLEGTGEGQQGTLTKESYEEIAMLRERVSYLEDENAHLDDMLHQQNETIEDLKGAHLEESLKWEKAAIMRSHPELEKVSHRFDTCESVGALRNEAEGILRLAESFQPARAPKTNTTSVSSSDSIGVPPQALPESTSISDKLNGRAPVLAEGSVASRVAARRRRQRNRRRG